ncbi:Uncharacterised protein [Yersinia enterocolitica]|nr:Uncharacterised protein [Yersinia enterocolitica]
MRDERAEILILVSPFAKAIAAETVAGHHCHILQMTVTPFFTDRAIVWVVSHQPFNHTLTERFGFTVINGNKGSISGWRHTGHHQTPTRVVRVLVLLYRTLAASADASQRRMPAKVRNIESQGETSL